MPRKWKEIATIGDCSPVDHGGGVVFKHGRNKYVLVFNQHGLSDLPDEMLEGEDGEDTELEVLFLELPKTFEAFREAYAGVEWSGPASYYSMEPHKFASMLREMRFAKGDDFVKKAAYMIEMLIGYGGYDMAGGNVNTMTAYQLDRLFRKKVF